MVKLTEGFGLSFAQSEVDFVIPDLAADLPIAIDPFLLYKSRDEGLRELHAHLLSIFNQGIELFRHGRPSELNRLIDFPEVNEIGFGYSDQKIQGSGLGWQLNRLLADTLTASEALQERGLRHVEELQLVSIGVGPDRVSDIAANVLKSFLIEYTQQQAELWSIPLTSGIPVSHYFDFITWDWSDDYFDLPVNPINGNPLLLVPRRIVRLLPWINYQDYVSTDFKMFLRPSKGPRMPRYPGMPKEKRAEASKKEVVDITRERLELLDQYVHRKEREGNKAEPTLASGLTSSEDDFNLGESFIQRLNTLPSGQVTATEYQRLVYEIINFLFEPDLTGGELEVSTYRGTERRDIVYVNEAERSFFEYVRNTYGSMFVLFEIKNVKKLDNDHVNQTGTYLGVRLGMLGFIVTRNSPEQSVILKIYSLFNDTPSVPRKTVLIVTDLDLVTMIRAKQQGENPARRLQDIYREFHWKIQ